MGTSLRQRIVDELKRRLAEISTANGYETEIGSVPILEMPVDLQAAELPVIGVLDLVNTVNQDYAREKRIMNELEFHVHAFLPRETDASYMRDVIGDMKHAVTTDPATGQRDETLGGIAVCMLPEQDGPDVPKDTYQIDGAVVAFRVQYLTAPFNDYE